MFATYILNSNEITPDFINNIRNTFNNNMIKITVSNIDETEYLMSSKSNDEHLLKAIENVEKKRNLIEVPFNEIIKAADEKDYI